MKIAMFSNWYISEESIGGTERFIQDLADTISKKGHCVDVYMLSGKSYRKNNVNYISLDLFGEDVIADEYMITNRYGKLNSIKAYEIIAKEIEKKVNVEEYNIIQLNSHLFLKCFENKKRIFTIHSNYGEFKILNDDTEFEIMVEIMKAAVKNSRTYFVVPSLYYSNLWKDIIKKNVVFIPHALNESRLVCDKSKELLIKKYNLSENKIKILLPNRLEMIQKQPNLILDALELLTVSQRQLFQIIFTGLDNQYMKNVLLLEKQSEQLCVDSKFISFDAISEAYKLTDLVLIPSKSESFGYSALESLYLGIPTILTDLPSFKEISEGTQSCIMFNGTKESLASILRMLVNKKIERKEISEEWKQRYELPLFAQRYIDIYGKE